MKCSNCEQDATVETSIMVYPTITKAPPAAVICKACQESVLTLKIVLTRDKAEDRFRYDGYLPVASAR